MNYIYISLIIAILCLILDEILPRLKNPEYFKKYIRIYNYERVMPSLQRNLLDTENLKKTLKMYIRNKYQFYPISPREIFFREFPFDYSVSKYSVVPIHGAIELVNPQKIKVTFCLNLTIPAFVIFVCILLFFRFPQAKMILIISFFLLVVCIWYCILIKKRIDVLLEAITRWLNEPSRSNTRNI